MKGIFVVGTDTGVGKTVVTAGLVRLALRLHLRVAAVKPVETGCRIENGVLIPEDGVFLLEACENGLSPDECVPFRFSLPASPFRAAAMEGRRLRVADLAEHVRTIAEEADLTLVEGAGGLMVPIEESRMMIDLVSEVGFPVLLVARTRLGTVNHTLLSLEALRSREIRVLGIILSQSDETSGPEEEYTAGDVARLAGSVPVVVLPRLAPPVLKDSSRLAAAMSAAWPDEVLDRWLGVRNNEARSME